MTVRLNPVKIGLAKLLSGVGAYHVLRARINAGSNNYIRIVNYHSIAGNYVQNFKQQLQYFQKYFQNVNKTQLEQFLKKEYVLTQKPGILITFDDGFLDNYEIAAPILVQFGFTGYFFVASDYISQIRSVPIYTAGERFMNWKHLNELTAQGHVVGCHTKTHHRMNPSDNIITLQNEIVIAKQTIDAALSQNTDIFCWVGGEENTYTRSAMDLIRQSGYQYVFTTMAGVTTPESDPMFLLRTNVESSWPIDILAFQIWGPMDHWSRGKRKRVYTNIMDVR